MFQMTPDAKGVLRKYQSEDAGIGSLSSDDSHPVNGPSFNTSSHADKNVRLHFYHRVTYKTLLICCLQIRNKDLFT